MAEKLILSNEFLTIQLNTLGAELLSVKNLDLGLEYMWQGNPAFWNKTSPVLFPIVGKLANNCYSYQHKFYEMAQHGFARNQEFLLVSQSEKSLTFQLKESEDSLAQYPFKFILEIKYTLDQQALSVEYKVINPAQKELLFSIGIHPGFNVPFFETERYEDYFISFNQPENSEQHLIEDGLISNHTKKVFVNPSKLELKKSMFYTDALVFKKLNSTVLMLQSTLHKHGLSLESEQFPYYGIWAKREADFICLEPWCGIADSVAGPFELAEKEGIIRLAPLEEFLRRITLRFF